MNRSLCILGLLVLGSACGGHALMRGTVVTASSTSEAQICMHDGEVAVGDVVNVMHHTCDVSAAANAAERQCVASHAGTATVTSLLNEHYAIVQAGGSGARRRRSTRSSVARSRSRAFSAMVRSVRSRPKSSCPAT